jgi:acyl-CoA dehydrogenase
MIDFELTPELQRTRQQVHEIGAGIMRPLSRHYDENEHEEAVELVDVARMLGREKGERGRDFLQAVVITEELSWADVGLTLAIPGSGLGNAAINAVATPEQKARFGGASAAMAITEPGCGSDSSAIKTTARLDPESNEWILNGEKIFVTGGRTYQNLVVWATLDRSQGRAAIKSFVVEKGTPGLTLAKLEHKLGIRASDTVAFVLQDCRIPYDNILGSPEIKAKGGFSGVMATFDATRPGVASMALGVARAALEFTKETLEKEGVSFPYDCGQHRLTAVQKTVIDMEANLDASRYLIWRSAAMLNTGVRNSLEASMAKAKAGRAATLITQKCVELLGPLGYSREMLPEKWMRDCKITDIFEGTGQIQMLIIARLILGYSRAELQ